MSKFKPNFINWLHKTDRKVNILPSTNPLRNEINFARQIYESESAREAVKAYYDQLKPLSICDAVESDKLGNEANILYRDQKLEKAAFLHTKAIYKAPTGSLCLARAHANRAIVLYKLGCYEAAFEDCTCAIEFKHPSEHSVLLRQAAIAWKLKDYHKMEHCMNSFKNCNIQVPQSVKDYHEKLKEAKFTTEESSDQTTINLPKLNKIKLSKSPTRGRYYIADEPIEAGELILEEITAVKTGSQDNEFRKVFFSNEENELVFTCDNCCETDIVPFPCYECRCVFYCSKRCREAHFPIHRYECGGYKIQLNEDNWTPLIAFRFLLTTFEEIVRKSQHISKSTVIPVAEELWPVLLQTAKDGELFSLHSNFQSSTNLGLEYGLLGFLFCYYLSDQTDFFDRTHRDRLTLMPSEVEWHIIVIGLYLRFVSMTKLNSLAFNRLMVTKPFAANNVSMTGLYSSIRADYSIVGIFPWFCFFNHSCEANTKVRINDSKIGVYSKTRIARGEEVTFDYIQMSATLNRNERKNRLKHYLGELDCDCKRCQNEEDSILVKFIGIPCNCGGVCIISNKESTCSECGEPPSLTKYQQLIERQVPRSPEEFIFHYGICEIMRKGLGNLGCSIFANYAANVLMESLKLANVKILNDDAINSFMIKLAIDLLEITQNVYFPPLRRAIYAAMLLDIVAIRKKNGFQVINFDHTIVEEATWFVTGKLRKIFDEFYKLYCL